MVYLFFAKGYFVFRVPHQKEGKKKEILFIVLFEWRVELMLNIKMYKLWTVIILVGQFFFFAEGAQKKERRRAQITAI